VADGPAAWTDDDPGRLGSITRVPDGGWRLRYQGPDGKRREGGRFATRTEAEQARARLRTSIRGGTTAEQRIDTPPAVHPQPRTDRVSQIEDGNHISQRGASPVLIATRVQSLTRQRVPAPLNRLPSPSVVRKVSTLLAPGRVGSCCRAPAPTS
jgi:hypothetical protein